jgi:hypothetical protein
VEFVQFNTTLALLDALENVSVGEPEPVDGDVPILWNEWVGILT